MWQCLGGQERQRPELRRGALQTVGEPADSSQMPERVSAECTLGVLVRHAAVAPYGLQGQRRWQESRSGLQCDRNFRQIDSGERLHQSLHIVDLDAALPGRSGEPQRRRSDAPAQFSRDFGIGDFRIGLGELLPDVPAAPGPFDQVGAAHIGKQTRQTGRIARPRPVFGRIQRLDVDTLQSFRHHLLFKRNSLEFLFLDDLPPRGALNGRKIRCEFQSFLFHVRIIRLRKTSFHSAATLIFEAAAKFGSMLPVVLNLSCHEKAFSSTCGVWPPRARASL